MNRPPFDAPARAFQTGASAAPPPVASGSALLPSRQLLYTQVHGILQKRILDGTLPEGSFLPNEFDLSREFQVSIGTIRKAVDLLVSDDLVTRQQGKGTTVNDRRWSKNKDRINRFRSGDGERIANWQVRELSYQMQSCPPQVCDKLAIAASETVHHLYRLRIAEGAWRICERLYIPVAALNETELGLSERRSISTIVRKHGWMLGRIDERVSVAAASAPESETLQVPTDTPLLMIERVIYDKGDKPVEFRITLCRPFNGAYWQSLD